MPCPPVLESAVGGAHSVGWLRSVARVASGVKKNVKLWLTMARHGASAVIDRKFLTAQAALPKPPDCAVWVVAGSVPLSGEGSRLSAWKMSPVTAA